MSSQPGRSVDFSAASSVRDILRSDLGLGATLSNDYVYKPPSDVSGESASGYEKNLSSSMMHELLKTQRELKAQLVDEMKAQRVDFERQIGELKTKLAAGSNDEMKTKLETELETYRRKCDAYRKQLLRQNKQAESGSAVSVDHFKIPLPDISGKCVFSTKMIAEENEAKRIAVMRAEVGGRNSDKLDPISPSCIYGKGAQHRYSNIAMKSVLIARPGPNHKRDGIGGTAKAESSLLAYSIAFAETNTSVNAIARSIPKHLGADCTSVSAVYEPKKGYGHRVACPTGTEAKPVNALGYIDPKIVVKGLHAAHMALDKVARLKKLISAADTLTLNVDISTFNEHAQLGVVVHMMYITDAGVDALSQPMQEVYTKCICLNSLPVSDKKPKDICKEDGDLFDKEVPCRLVMELALSGHLWDVMQHPCQFWGMDRGCECVGAGRGKVMAMLRAALVGRGGPLEQIFVPASRCTQSSKASLDLFLTA